MSRTVKLNPEQRERLAQAIAKRREELGHKTQAELSAMGGGKPSLATIGLLERGERVSVSRAVLRDLEVAARWADGSTDAIIADRAPTPLDDLVPAGDIPAMSFEARLADLDHAESGYPSFVDDDPFFKYIWDFADVPEDEREYAILHVQVRRLRRNRRRQAGSHPAASRRREVDRDRA